MRSATLRLMHELFDKSKGRPIYLETSTETNLPFYAKLGFVEYAQLDLGYIIYFMKRQ